MFDFDIDNITIHDKILKNVMRCVIYMNRLLAILLFISVLFFLFCEIEIISSIIYTNPIQLVVSYFILLVTLDVLIQSINYIINPDHISSLFIYLLLCVIIFFVLFFIFYVIDLPIILYFIVISISVPYIASKICDKLNLSFEEKKTIVSISTFFCVLTMLYIILFSYFFIIPLPKKVQSIKNPTPYKIQWFLVRNYHPYISKKYIDLYKISPFLYSMIIQENPFKSKVVDCQSFSRMYYSTFKYYGYKPRYILFFNVPVRRSVEFPLPLFLYYICISLLNGMKPLHIAVYMNNKVYDFKVIRYYNGTNVVVPVIRNLKFYSKYYKSYAICNQYMCKVYSF